MRVLHGVLTTAMLLASPALASTSAVDTLLAKSRAAEQAGNRDAAVRFVQAAIVADPSRASSYTALGDVYMHASQSEFASFYYAEALTIDPQDAAAQHGLELADKASATATAAAASSLDKNQSQH